MRTPEQKSFPHQTAVSVAGIDGVLLQKWRGRGLLDGVGVINVTGRAEYTRRDILTLRLVAEFIRFGFPVSNAAELARGVVGAADENGVLDGTAGRFLAFVHRLKGEEIFAYEIFGAAKFSEFIAGAKDRVTRGDATLFIPLTDMIEIIDQKLAVLE